MRMAANRVLFGALVVMVVATTAFLWVAGADPQAMQLIASFLALSSVVALIDWLDRRSSRRDPNDPDGHLHKWYGDGLWR
jgi:hypothetical protein